MLRSKRRQILRTVEKFLTKHAPQVIPQLESMPKIQQEAAKIRIYGEMVKALEEEARKN